jgi:hypothetical protein
LVRRELKVLQVRLAQPVLILLFLARKVRPVRPALKGRREQLVLKEPKGQPDRPAVPQPLPLAPRPRELRVQTLPLQTPDLPVPRFSILRFLKDLPVPKDRKDRLEHQGSTA